LVTDENGQWSSRRAVRRRLRPVTSDTLVVLTNDDQVLGPDVGVRIIEEWWLDSAASATTAASHGMPGTPPPNVDIDAGSCPWRTRNGGSGNAAWSSGQNRGVSPELVARFDALFRATYSAVRRYAFHRGVAGADADDLVSETFLVAWRRLDSVPRDNPVPWLLAVAANVQRNRARSTRRYQAMIDRLPMPPPAASPADPNDLHTAVATALAALSEDDREILCLVAWDGLTPQEAATVLGTSSGAARLRLHRARRRLAVLLGDRLPVKQSAGGGQFEDDSEELPYEPTFEF
jgi:RNA polymerase sigma factor (sigma-70 family)